jgi:anti-sigma B factor antagonist
MGPFSTLRIEEQAGVTTATFRDGSILDAVAIQRIAKELIEIADSPAGKRFVLDFSEVRFFSSQALGTLITVRQRAEKNKGKMVLAALKPDLKKVFKLTSLDKLFKFYDTASDANVALGGQALPERPKVVRPKPATKSPAAE